MTFGFSAAESSSVCIDSSAPAACNHQRWFTFAALHCTALCVCVCVCPRCSSVN